MSVPGGAVQRGQLAGMSSCRIVPDEELLGACARGEKSGAFRHVYETMDCARMRALCFEGLS